VVRRRFIRRGEKGGRVWNQPQQTTRGKREIKERGGKYVGRNIIKINLEPGLKPLVHWGKGGGRQMNHLSDRRRKKREVD